MIYRDLQYLFRKIITSVTNTTLNKRTRRIFSTSNALSNKPHLQRAFVIGGCIFSWLDALLSSNLIHIALCKWPKNWIKVSLMHIQLDCLRNYIYVCNRNQSNFVQDTHYICFQCVYVNTVNLSGILGNYLQTFKCRLALSKPNFESCGNSLFISWYLKNV